MKNLLTILAGVLILGAWASGLMVVDSNEVAVVYRLGAVDRVATSGLALRAPWPIEREERILVTEVRRTELTERRLLTGDTNLVDLTLVAQFVVSDPVDYALSLDDADATVAAQVAAAANEVVSTMEVDVLFTTGRSALEQRVRDQAQAQLDVLGAGVALSSVDVRDLAPPPAVVDAFNDVSSARGDKETLALAADAYASKVIPDARGEASRLVEQARGESTSLLARAEGEISRFEALAEPHATDARGVELELYRGALERIAAEAEIVGAKGGSQVVIE